MVKALLDYRAIFDETISGRRGVGVVGRNINARGSVMISRLGATDEFAVNNKYAGLGR